MGKKQIVIMLSIGGLLIATFTVGRNVTSKSIRPNPPLHAHASEQIRVVPDYVVYDFLFRNVVRLREKTTELQAQDRIGAKPYFPLQREARLSVGQSTALEAIAFACRQQVRQQDERAKVVIAGFQSSFPEGRVPEDGAPPPPPELKTLWEERNAIIVRARDQLRVAFGEAEFARFDDYAKFHYGANKSPVTINPVNPNPKQK